jgi:hypothetical protein
MNSSQQVLAESAIAHSLMQIAVGAAYDRGASLVSTPRQDGWVAITTLSEW